MAEQFARVDGKKVIAARIGYKEGGNVLEYLERITTEGHDSDTHKFECNQIPGVCNTCGWIHPDLICSDCGRPVRDHFVAALKGIKGLESVEIVEIEILIVPIPSRRRGPWGLW